MVTLQPWAKPERLRKQLSETARSNPRFRSRSKDVKIKVRHGGQIWCKIVIFGDLGFQWKMKPEHVIFRGAYSVF